MSAREFEMAAGSILAIERGESRRVRIRRGDVWLTQEDSNDYLLKTGQTMELNADGKAVVTAYAPTLLELYRADPTGVRAHVERVAQRARNKALWAVLRRMIPA